MIYFDQVTNLLNAAQAELVFERSYHLLTEAVRLCEDWEESEANNPQAFILHAHILKELAHEEQNRDDRAKRWKDALKTISKQWEKLQVSEFADMYSLIATDCFQDELSSLTDSELQRHLSIALKYLDISMKQTNSPQTKALLLTRKSSVLRHKSMAEFSREAKVRRLEESVRCAQKSLEESMSASGILESAQAEWSLARYESTDDRYVSRLRKAENFLKHESLRDIEIARLTLARFYRLNFRALEACECFPHSLDEVKHIRRLLRECYIYAESATHLWYSDYPQSVVQHHLREALSLLELAISSGYQTARVIINLAFLRAILEDVPAAVTSLGDICLEKGSISWQQAIKLVSQSSSPDLLVAGFALGIDQSGVWTRLGTFVYSFLQDKDLAESLYRTAIRINPRDPISLTNLARFLVETGNTDKELTEAERLLQRAQNFADRRFRWWRSVLADLKKKSNQGESKNLFSQQSIIQPPYSDLKEIKQRSYSDLKEIKQRFLSIAVLKDNQQRGYELEVLVYEIAKLTFGTAARPYRIKRSGGAISQVDGYFEHKGEKYRVECKWLTEPVNHNDIVVFSDKLDVVGISGLFVSMSGFTESAIERARELRYQKPIILVDSEEMYDAFMSKINFDELLSIKRLHFDQRSEPYFKVKLQSIESALA